jgi:aminoglycoside phosphotransferase (APT) family kinase protein
MYNVLVAPEPPARVVAILDWETATIGDPLLDLAGFCEIWTSTTASLAAGEGWPTRDEIVARYAATRGLGSVGDLTYYEVLYQFRFAVLLEGIYQRSLRDPSRPDQDMVGERVIAGMARAVELIDGSAAGTGARG